MMNVWITTAEVAVQPGDMPSGDTLGFMKITMWALSESDFIEKVRAYFRKYNWEVLSVENTEQVDPSRAYGDEANAIIGETLLDRQAVRLGTYYSYKAN
jgi:hypothetical protein